jgi:cytochrome b pre-mRNA-processing protein 3
MAFTNPFLRGRRDSAALGLYTVAVDQARRPEFYAVLGVADSLDGRFDLIVLHVFLLLHRLGQAGREVRALSQALFDLMFADMDRNLREMGVSDLGVGKRVKTMAKAFYGRVAAYEPGLQDSGVLQEALRRNLYRGATVADETLAAMASYVLAEAASLAGQDTDQLKEGRARFGDPVMP